MLKQTFDQDPNHLWMFQRSVKNIRQTHILYHDHNYLAERGNAKCKCYVIHATLKDFSIRWN